LAGHVLGHVNVIRKIVAAIVLSIFILFIIIIIIVFSKVVFNRMGTLTHTTIARWSKLTGGSLSLSGHSVQPLG
jgi:hypothetical protein